MDRHQVAARAAVPLTGPAGLARRRGKLAERPRLDLTVQKADLIASFPVFAAMDEPARRMLARALRTVYAAPGDIILRRAEMPRQVWFIASGAVESDTAGRILRLGRGEMFGHLAVISGRSRKSQVTAITHCTLLALDEARFMALLRRNTDLRAAVQDSADRRGVALDLSALAA